jgi:uncharacterized protein YecT (DUF1311 family)
MIPKSGNRFSDKIMRKRNSLRAAIILACVALLTSSPASAQADKPAARDSMAIQHCIKAKTGRHWNWEHCIGIVSEPCAKDEGSMTPSQVIACYAREEAVWDDILNESFRRLRDVLEAEQVGKLREMQRAWIVSRDKNCEFLYDYFQGSMANTMMAACRSRATGMQALYLLGFADDVAERK